jgi:hypothetical protein
MTVLLYKEWNKVNFHWESGGDWNCGAGDTGNVQQPWTQPRVGAEKGGGEEQPEPIG